MSATQPAAGMPHAIFLLRGALSRAVYRDRSGLPAAQNGAALRGGLLDLPDASEVSATRRAAARSAHGARTDDPAAGADAPQLVDMTRFGRGGAVLPSWRCDAVAFAIAEPVWSELILATVGGMGRRAVFPARGSRSGTSLNMFT